MQVRFIGDPTERDGIPSRRHLTLFGKDFVLDQVSDVSDLPEKEKGLLAKHSHFEVVADATPEPVANETDARADDGAEAPRSARGKKKTEE